MMNAAAVLDKFQNSFVYVKGAPTAPSSRRSSLMKSPFGRVRTVDDNEHAHGSTRALLSVAVSKRRPLARSPLGQRSVKKFREPG